MKRYNVKIFVGSQAEPIFLTSVKVEKDIEARHFVFDDGESFWVYAFADIINMWATPDGSYATKIEEQVTKVYNTRGVQGGKIQAIKTARELLNIPLKDAKEYVDDLERKGVV